nr:hypothetical protein [Sedimentibacter sp.]
MKFMQFNIVVSVGDELNDMLAEPMTAIASPQQVRFNEQVINIACENIRKCFSGNKIYNFVIIWYNRLLFLKEI